MNSQYSRAFCFYKVVPTLKTFGDTSFFGMSRPCFRIFCCYDYSCCNRACTCVERRGHLCGSLIDQSCIVSVACCIFPRQRIQFSVFSVFDFPQIRVLLGVFVYFILMDVQFFYVLNVQTNLHTPFSLSLYERIYCTTPSYQGNRSQECQGSKITNDKIRLLLFGIQSVRECAFAFQQSQNGLSLFSLQEACTN